MKKIFTLIAFAMSTMALTAADYTDQLSIWLNGEGPTESAATISIDQQSGSDNLYTIVLKQFSFGGNLIGDVTMTDVKGTTGADGTIYFQTQQEASITNGDIIATLLGNKVDVAIKNGSSLKDGTPYLVIYLPVNLGDDNIIYVDAAFGNGGYQIPNSNFESFHTAKYSNKTSDEPDAWHSFMSSTGSLASSVSSAIHTFTSDDIRPESSGTKSVKIVSTPVLSAFSANGTITTGRLKAGSMSASNTSNCSFLDISNTDKDANGDPFYTLLNGRPDSISVWVKFHPGTNRAQTGTDKATISAIITDGTYCQDPADKTYTNIVAKAQNAAIESKEEAWQKITVPFDYDSYTANGVSPKAILVTISTCATPSGGSKSSTDPDALWVDDLSLVYNCGLSSLKVKGTEVETEAEKTEYDVDGVSGTINADDIEVTSDGHGAIISKTLEDTADGVKATVTITSNDYLKQNTYTVNIKGGTTGITKTQTTQGSTAASIYNVNGQRVHNMTQRGLYIIKAADGTVRKVMRK